MLRRAYLQIIPELEPFFLAADPPAQAPRALAHGMHQSSGNLAKSLTTTSSVVAALNSMLAGSLTNKKRWLEDWTVFEPPRSL